MYFYHGNRHYYLTRIFLADSNLKDTLGLINLSNEEYNDLCYALADNLYELTDDFVKNNDLSANEYYDKERATRAANSAYVSNMFMGMQAAIQTVKGKLYSWYMIVNKPIYVGILKSLVYGAIKHFFYENRDKYLPQYDWYLINQNPKRKEIMDTLFLEFDKLATISDAIQYYQDPDDIPIEFLIRLQEITGLTMNTYGKLFSSDQLRSLTKHLIEVWREKSSLFSIELFFSCMGIDCSAQELWFDRRLYYNTSNFNDYTKINSLRNFGYYLTPRMPHSTSYSFSGENADYSAYTPPRPSRIWDHVLSTSTSSEDDTVRELLGYKESDLEFTYTYFKSNYLLLDFSYINQSNVVTKDEIAMFKELVNYMLPIYMRTVYVNDYESSTGGDDWDILKTWDVNSIDSDQTKYIKDETGKDRPVEIFKLFDTQNASDLYNNSQDGPSNIKDFYPPEYAGANFVSGSYIIVNDTRLETFIVKNPTFNWKSAVTSDVYDVVGGEEVNSSEANHSYPVFYDDEEYDYFYASEAGKLMKSDGTEGDLTITEEPDGSEIVADKTITRYFFQDNGSVTEIYPVMFAEDNNGRLVSFVQGYVTDETFALDMEPQVPWRHEVSGETVSYETFDVPEFEKSHNLFEASTWKDNSVAINGLYDGQTWVGDIQYEYYEYDNPIQYMEADLSSELTITLI